MEWTWVSSNRAQLLLLFLTEYVSKLCSKALKCTKKNAFTTCLASSGCVNNCSGKLLCVLLRLFQFAIYLKWAVLCKVYNSAFFCGYSSSRFIWNKPYYAKSNVRAPQHFERWLKYCLEKTTTAVGHRSVVTASDDEEALWWRAACRIQIVAVYIT